MIVEATLVPVAPTAVGPCPPERTVFHCAKTIVLSFCLASISIHVHARSRVTFNPRSPRESFSLASFLPRAFYSSSLNKVTCMTLSLCIYMLARQITRFFISCNVALLHFGISDRQRCPDFVACSVRTLGLTNLKISDWKVQVRGEVIWANHFCLTTDAVDSSLTGALLWQERQQQRLIIAELKVIYGSNKPMYIFNRLRIC